MKNKLHSILAGLGALFVVSFASAQSQMASIAITPATGVVTLAPQWAVGDNLIGFHLMAQDLSLGGGANQFYSVKGTAIPEGGDIAAFTRYIAASGAATNHEDIGSKLTPNSYSGLTSADPDVGYGAVNLYFIHHKDSADYFTALIPSSGTASAVTDLKPMSGPGGPETLGDKGYFGLTFAAANLGYGLNTFYYLRDDPVTNTTWFGTLIPALLGLSADKFDLGVAGHNALAFTGTDVGFGTDKMYYLRLDPITGFTILGTLHPLTGDTADIANLGSVFTTLTFVPGDVGYGSGNFYTTGEVNVDFQIVSFAAIADKDIADGSFTVNPTASSGLPVTLTLVSGSVGYVSISEPVAGVYTITPSLPGVVTLEASQAGQIAPIAYEANLLRQSFTVTGTPDPLVVALTEQVAELEEDNALLTTQVAVIPGLHDEVDDLEDEVNALKDVRDALRDDLDDAEDSISTLNFRVLALVDDNALLQTQLSAPSSDMVNLSVRAPSGTGEKTIISGLVISGNAPKDVLIRVVGPGLASFGVVGVLADPKLTLYRGPTEIAANDDWDAGLAQTFSEVGAFALESGSKDAALLITLSPGIYTVHANTAASDEGVVLVEVYDVR